MGFKHPAPLIVCGFVRSGTQMCATILHNSQDVELQSEIPVKLGPPTLAWLKTVKREQADTDPERFYRLCRSVFRNLPTPATPQSRSGVKWFGHKTPRHESFFQMYEELFGQPEARARYVYCLRNPYDVWRSYRVMPWNEFPTVGRFRRGWTRSVAAFEHMRSLAPERVLLFNLDEMSAAPDRSRWIQANLLDPLGISIETLRKPLDTLQNSNSAKAKFGLELPELPARERSAIAGSRAVHRVLREYFPELVRE